MKATLTAFLVATTITMAWAEEGYVPYPTGYLEWRHVKSMVIESGHPLFGAFGGIHHIYANDRALQGYRSDHFPDGSVLVFDLLEALQDGAAVVEGKRKVLGVMVKDAHRYEATGGWGFEGFGAGDSGSRVVGSNAASACFACHQPQQAQDFTFSRLRDG